MAAAHLPRVKRWRHRRLSTEHAFDKLGAIDCTLGEFEVALEASEIIEESLIEHGVTKELVILTRWTRPLHLVVIVDELRSEERILTIYEPDQWRWSGDYRTRQ